MCFGVPGRRTFVLKLRCFGETLTQVSLSLPASADESDAVSANPFVTSVFLTDADSGNSFLLRSDTPQRVGRSPNSARMMQPLSCRHLDKPAKSDSPAHFGNDRFVQRAITASAGFCKSAASVGRLVSPPSLPVLSILIGAA
jgi:hypothetical protein